MRAGWQIKTLGELAVKITDGSHNPPKGVEMSEFLMLSSQNVWNGFLDKSIARHLSKQDFLLEDKRTCAREGDVLLTIVGTIGRTCVLSSKDTNITFQRSVCVIKPKPELNPFFLSYQLQFKNKEINEQANGAAQKGFYLKQVERLPIFITSIPEQHRIVDILDREFAKIDALKANAEKSLQAAKDLYAEMLDTSLSSQDGWKTKTLDEVCSKITDGTHHSPPNTPSGEYKYITAKNIKPWGLDLTDLTFVSKVIHKEIYSRCHPNKGDVLYIKDGATTGIAIVNPLEEEFSLLSSVALLKPLPTEITSRYLCYAMNSPRMYAFVRERMDGAAITRITLKKIKAFPVSYPTINEQNAIVSRLDDLNGCCNALQQNYQKTLILCDDLKQSLLRKAFIGEL